MSHCDSLVLPDLLKICPWNPSTNPNYEKAAAESSALTESLILHLFSDAKHQHFVRSAVELLASYTYPYAGFEEFRTCCDCINLLFAVDEITDDQDLSGVRETIELVDKAMKGKIHEGPPIVHLTMAFRDRVVSDVAPNRGRRLVEQFSGYLQSVLYEADLRERHRVLSLEEYEPHRRENGGVRICLTLAEYVLGLDLPDAVIGNDLLQEMYWAAIDAVVYANDLYSYNKEQAKPGHEGNNLLTVLMRERNLTIQQAADHIGALFKSLLDSFQRNKEALPSIAPGVDQDVAKYVFAMEQWIVGNIGWSFASPRYFGSEHEEVRRSLVVKLKEPLVRED